MSRLVIGRKVGQSIEINGPCRVTVDEVRGNNVRISVEADVNVSIMRSELVRLRALQIEPEVVEP